MGDGHLCGSGARELTSGRLHGHDRQSRSVRVPAVGRRRRDPHVHTGRRCVRFRRCVRRRPRQRRYSGRRRRLEWRGHVHDRDPAGQRRANVLDRWEPDRGVASRGAVGVGIRVGDAGAGQRVGAAHDVRRSRRTGQTCSSCRQRSRPTELSPTRPRFLGLGVANVTVRVVDDGGTANGGADTSAPTSFTITIV